MDLTRREILREQRHISPLSVIIFDVDRFKDINDTYSHQAGDEVLRQLTETAGEVIRDHDVFGRIGGEEFAITLVTCEINAAAGIAERLKTLIAEATVMYRTNRYR